MKVLFLDDDMLRQRSARYHFRHGEFTGVCTAADAIRALQTDTYDLVHLDHDLGGMVYTQSAQGTGYEVAQYIASMTTPPAHVVIHSWNPAGANNMKAVLERVTSVEVSPFPAWTVRI